MDDPLKISILIRRPDRPLISALLTPHLYLYPDCLFFHKRFLNLAVFKEDLTRAFEEFDTDALYDTLTVISQLFAANPQKAAPDYGRSLQHFISGSLSSSGR